MTQRISQFEFVALMAMLHATVALSMDAMLPALTEIGQALSPDAPNRAQLVILAFVIGMGVATLVAGPLADALGRRPVLLGGIGLFILGAVLAHQAQSMEAMLAARLLQGIGAAGPRVGAFAMIRDLYSGRDMARVNSIVMMAFMAVPAAAPFVGMLVMSVGGWRSVFILFVAFALIALIWLVLRQPETLPPVARRPLRMRLIGAALVQMARHPVVRLAVLAQVFCYVVLFNTVTLIQPVFTVVFDREASFPAWFAVMALATALAAFVNARLVTRFGMRRMAIVAFGTQVFLSAGMMGVWWAGLSGTPLFVVYLIWQATLFFQNGLTVGNLNALAMEPMGHVAGLAAAVIGSVAAVFGALLAIPFGQAFDGTLLPMTLGALLASLAAWACLRAMPET
jgi:DHA1 family bicyclomycin/chloramphenicol resistance-like MFS transporter